MWQRLTVRARSVILRAQEEAEKAQSSHIDTEHLLIGLLTVGEGVVAHLLLEEAEVNTSVIKAEANDAVNGYAKGAEPKLTPLAKRVLDFAADEARRMSHNYIGTEHLLLALIREESGRASQILVAHGVDLEKARTLVTGSSWGAELAEAQSSAKPSQSENGDERQLLSLLERREDLLVEILGLDVLALKKARVRLLVDLDLFEEAAILRDEIENEHS